MDSRILFSFSLSTFPKPRLAFILFDSSFKIINLYLSIVLPFSLPPPSLLFRRFLSKRKVININRKESCLKGSSFNDQLFWYFVVIRIYLFENKFVYLDLKIYLTFISPPLLFAPFDTPLLRTLYPLSSLPPGALWPDP